MEKKIIEWRSIERFPDYEISSIGDVRRVTKPNGSPKTKSKLPYILKPCASKLGYFTYNIMDRNGQRVTMRRHMLVALAFHGPKPSPKHQVAHLDGSRENDCASNLCWATQRENESHKVMHGTHLHGSRCHRAIMTENDVISMRYQHYVAGKRICDIARSSQFDYYTIYSAVRGVNWKYVKSFKTSP